MALLLKRVFDWRFACQSALAGPYGILELVRTGRIAMVRSVGSQSDAPASSGINKYVKQSS